MRVLGFHVNLQGIDGAFRMFPGNTARKWVIGRTLKETCCQILPHRASARQLSRAIPHKSACKRSTCELTRQLTKAPVLCWYFGRVSASSGVPPREHDFGTLETNRSSVFFHQGWLSKDVPICHCGSATVVLNMCLI